MSSGRGLTAHLHRFITFYLLPHGNEDTGYNLDECPSGARTIAPQRIFAITNPSKQPGAYNTNTTQLMRCLG